MITLLLLLRVRTRGRHHDIGRVTSRAVHRRPASRHRRSLTAPVCIGKRIVDLARTRYTMCCSLRTAPTAFISTSRTDRRMARWSRSSKYFDWLIDHYRILGLLLATDATRRPGLNVMLCSDRLFQQYVVDACAKMEQQRLNYLRFNQNSRRSWRSSGEWRRSRRSSSAQFYAYKNVM